MPDAAETETPQPLPRAPMSWFPAANPVFLREMRESIRTEAKSDPWRFKFFILLVIAGALVYGASVAGYFHLNAPVAAFYVLALAESMYLSRPTDPASILAREKQQNTFEPLMLTSLTPGRYLRGHLLHQLAVSLRRIAVTLPLFGVVYVLGGFPLGQFLMFQLLLLVYGCALSATVMAMANATPALAEGDAGAMTGRRGARRPTPASNLNPIAILVYALIPLVFISGNVWQRGQLFSILLASGDPASPPLWDLVRGFGLLHPFLALIVYGDALAYGRAVPVWALCLLFWGLVLQASFFTFVHQIMVRKFRPDRGYRVGRWLLFVGTILLIAALAWRLPVWALVAVQALTAFYLALRFLNPMGVPEREYENWQLLPRSDLAVHRAGNMFPFLVAVAAPSWAVQALLVERAATPGLGLASFYANAAVFLAVAAILLGGLNARLRTREKELGAEKTTTSLAPDKANSRPAEPTAGGGKKNDRKSFAPTNPALSMAVILWLLPLAAIGFEPLARPTPAGPFVASLLRWSEPLLLANPLRFLYSLAEANAHRVVQGLPLHVAGPPALPRLGFALPGDYYQAALAVSAALVLGLMSLFVVRSRRLERALRASTLGGAGSSPDSLKA